MCKYKRGAIVLSEKAKEAYTDYLDASIHYCNDNLFDYIGTKLKIDYVITDSMEFNANCSLLPEGCYKLNIRSEVFEKIFKILNTLLYEKNMKFYTIVSGERKYDLKKANIYLELMHHISCRLIIYHELGHIFNGHLDYYNSLSMNQQKLSLFMDSRQNQLLPLESQVLEMDADAFAATRLIGQYTYSPNIKSINDIETTLLKNQLHALLLVIISSCITFSIMGLGYKRESVNHLESKYLPLRTRQDYYVRCVLNAYKVLNNVDLDADLELLDIKFYREVLYNIEQYVNLYHREALGFQEKEIDSSNNRNEMDTALIRHSDFLETFWKNEMRDKLSPFAYFHLAE